MLSSMLVAPSVVVAGAGLLDVRLDQEALPDHVTRARFDTAKHLDLVAIPLTQFEHAHFVGVAHLREHDGEVTERAAAGCLDGERAPGAPPKVTRAFTAMPGRHSPCGLGSSARATTLWLVALASGSSRCNLVSTTLPPAPASSRTGCPLRSRAASVAEGVQVEPELRQIGDLEERLVTGNVAGVRVPCQHNASDRRRDGKAAQAVAALDHGQRLSQHVPYRRDPLAPSAPARGSEPSRRRSDLHSHDTTHQPRVVAMTAGPRRFNVTPAASATAAGIRVRPS